MDVTSYLLGKKAGGGGGEVNLQDKEITITENTTTNITPDTGYDGLNSVSVTTNVSGGSGGLDWSTLGYENTPQGIIDGYNYALEIKNNWVAATDLTNKFYEDKKLIIMPLVDTSSATNMNYMFYTCWGLNSLPILDTSNATSMQYMFMGCSALYTVPLFNTSEVTSFSNMFNACLNLTSVPQFNTSKGKDMRNMFSGCSKLKNIPVLNTSSCTRMTGIVGNCPNLTAQSLNNLLIMCINVSASYSVAKTLANLGLTSTHYPASTIQALSNYQDFINAGWTIGYE